MDLALKGHSCSTFPLCYEPSPWQGCELCEGSMPATRGCDTPSFALTPRAWPRAGTSTRTPLTALCPIRYIGLSFFTFKCHKWNAGFTAWAVLAILVSRALIVYPLTVFINICRGRKRKKISMAYQHCLMGAGLRGAIAFALAMSVCVVLGFRPLSIMLPMP